MLKVAAKSEREAVAFQRFLLLRWPETGGKPLCPNCGADKPYHISTRKKFKCRKCYKQFSPTVGTAFASHKLTFVQLVDLLDCGFANTLSAAKETGITWKTVKSFEKKREAIAPGTYGGRAKSAAPMSRSYPYAYIRSTRRIEWYDKILQLIPREIPDHLRADICQNIALEVLEGRAKIEDVRKHAAKSIRDVFSFHDMVYRHISLYTPINSAGDELITLISTEQYQRAMDSA